MGGGHVYLNSGLSLSELEKRGALPLDDTQLKALVLGKTVEAHNLVSGRRVTDIGGTSLAAAPDRHRALQRAVVGCFQPTLETRMLIANEAPSRPVHCQGRLPNSGRLLPLAQADLPLLAVGSQ
ncbi:MAG: hypothetical protein ACI9NT_002394 [Bacteroidia bacterium]|jgi:hypothetical protein